MVRPTKCGQIHLLYFLSGAFPTSRHSVEVLSAFMVPRYGTPCLPSWFGQSHESTCFNHILQQNDHRLLSWFVLGDLIERPPSSPDVSATTQLDTSNSFREEIMFISDSFPSKKGVKIIENIFLFYYIYIRLNKHTIMCFLSLETHPPNLFLQHKRNTSHPQPQLLPTALFFKAPCKSPRNSSAELLDSLMFQFSIPRSSRHGQLGWTPPDPEPPKKVPRKWLHQEKDVTIFHESSWVSSQQKTSHKGKYESDESLHPGHHLSSAFSMIPEKVLHSKKTSSRIFLGAKFLVGRNVAAEGASMPLKKWRSAAAMK